MRHTIVVLLFCVPGLAALAAQPLEGRWEGSVRIPGRAMPMVLDLARNPAGDWTGSIILPGLGLKGALLDNIVARGDDIAFDLGNALRTPDDAPARLRARVDPSGGMAGEFDQAGNVAKISLQKIGPAQVDTAPRSTAIGHVLEDRWIGEFELGGYPRHVTLTLENHAAGAATATLVIVGKQTSNLPVALVTEEGSFLRVESPATHVNFEARFVEQRDELQGTVELGPFELPLVLRRAARKPS
jgi:hypothetical protein